MELTKAEQREINSCFTKYIFYEPIRNGRICTCTHCGQQYVIKKEKVKTTDEKKLLAEPHNGGARCIKCGALCEVKSLGKSKSRQNLYEEQKIVIIRRYNHNYLRAWGILAVKSYNTTTVNPEIKYEFVSEYEFRPGKVKQYKFYRSYYRGTTSKELCEVAKEPFNRLAAFWYSIPDNSYTIIGLEKFKTSFLKYHMLDEFSKWYAQAHYRRMSIEVKIMSYLCRFCEYPQMEMLQKLGYYDVVENLVEINNKSFPYVNWKAKDIASFFRLSKQEFKIFRKEKLNLDFLRCKKLIEKYFGKYTITKMIEMYKKIESKKLYDTLSDGIIMLKDAGIPINEGVKYIVKQYGLLKEKSLRGLFLEMRDYYRMGREIGYDFTNHNVAYPKNLIAAHDTAAELQRAILKEKRQKELEEKERAAAKTLKNYDKLYEFKDDNFLIIVPHTIEEIIEEGKRQSHCVGGYAARHMEGVLTICFLRAVDEPNKSLYTIEMHGKTLTQVQGYKNRTPLTPEAKEFFDIWLEWVKAGSRRDKQGKPIIKKSVMKTA